MQTPQKPYSKIGDILVQCGMVTPNELDEALVVAHQEGLRLGEALVKLGVLGEDQLVWALGIQFDLSHMELTEDTVDWDLLISLPIEQLHGLMVLPLTPTDGMHRVVIADPTVDGLKEFVEELFPGRQVLVQLASAHDLDEMFEQVNRRRHRASQTGVAAPWTPPPANALMRWIPRLESGRIERVVVTPLGRDEFIASTWPLSSDGVERLSVGEIKSILDRLYDYFTCETPSSRVVRGLRGPARPGETNAVRSIVLEGLTGHLLALEAIGPAPPTAKRRPVTVLTGPDPAMTKSVLFAEAAARSRSDSAAPPPLIALESHVDFLSQGVFQCELCDPAARIGTCRRLVTAARPDVMILELDSEDDLARLPVDTATAAAGRFFVVLRGFVRKAPPFPSLEGVDRVNVPADARAARDQIRPLLRDPETA